MVCIHKRPLNKPRCEYMNAQWESQQVREPSPYVSEHFLLQWTNNYENQNTVQLYLKVVWGGGGPGARGVHWNWRMLLTGCRHTLSSSIREAFWGTWVLPPFPLGPSLFFQVVLEMPCYQVLASLAFLHTKSARWFLEYVTMFRQVESKTGPWVILLPDFVHIALLVYFTIAQKCLPNLKVNESELSCGHKKA